MDYSQRVSLLKAKALTEVAQKAWNSGLRYKTVPLLMDALRRASAGRITAVIPYFGYARQDRKVAPRVPISAKLVADLITTSGASRVLTVDLHAGLNRGRGVAVAAQSQFGLGQEEPGPA